MSCAVLFGVALFGVLYWRYPFDGMIISDSWYWYLYDAGEFLWPVSVRGGGDWSPQPYTPDWTALTTRRGLMPVMVMMIDRLVVGDKRLFLNLLCLLVLAANAALFGYIVWRLAGVQRLYPIVLVALLYPFAAGSHFWQHLVLNNLATTFFLISLALFLRVLLSKPLSWNGATAFALACSLICYWISILTVDYAIFLSPLYVYLALYYTNGGAHPFRFGRFVSPQTAVALGYVALTGLAVVLFSKDAPTVLAYSAKLGELASKTGGSISLMATVTALGHAGMLFLAALIFNSVGLILQPAVLVWRDSQVLLESAWILPSIVLLAAGGVLGLFLAAHDQPVVESKDRAVMGFLVTLGVSWAVLAYLPFASSFSYPRVVGLMADRINILALWGVALVVGTFGHCLFESLCCGTIGRGLAFGAGAWLVSVVLIANLYIQKEYYVETYLKERQLALLILDQKLVPLRDQRKPVILLDRTLKNVFPREQLIVATDRPDVTERAFGLLRFLVNRYFIQEYVSSSYHLNGVMMFGCCPGAAPATIAGYARLQGRDYVPVYTIDKTFRFEEDGEGYRLGYEQSNVLSAQRGVVSWVEYPKRDYGLYVIQLSESFFRLRGPLEYSTRATVEVS